MAVKQLLVEHGEGANADARLQLLLRQHEFASRSGLSRDRICISTVIGLGTCTVPTDPVKFKEFIADLQKVEDLLRVECANVDLMYATLKALYNEISDSTKTLSPAMSIVLRLISPEMVPEAVKWIIASGYKEDSLYRALYNLCQWLTKWTYTPNLSPLIVLFMEALNQQHLNIIVEVTRVTIEPLFKLLILPDIRKYVGPVVFYMLGNVENDVEVYEKILPHVYKTASFWQRENSKDSRFYMEKLARLCSKVKVICPEYHALQAELESKIDVDSLEKTSDAVVDNFKPWDDTLVNSAGNRELKVGLFNLGNTCYMNSVLQALYMTKIFRNEILNFDHNGVPLFISVQDLFALLQYSNRVALSPHNILRIARPAGFNEGLQHDSSEFLLHLLDILHEQEEKDAKEKGETATLQGSNLMDTIVQQSFGGRTMTVFTCSKCGGHSEKIDNFRELPLCFPDDGEEYSKDHSVSSLLDLYLQPEKLCDDNKYHCEKCGGLTDGEKVTRVIQAPRRLIMTIKHFKYDTKSFRKIKLLHTVKLEEYIQLNEVCYELYAVVVHSGYNTDHGHYYCMAKENEKWYKFNDYDVHKLSQTHAYELRSPDTPYILFYRSQQSEEPENIEKNSLSSRLQDLVEKDFLEREKETPKKSTVNLWRSWKNDEPPPPPGCGDGNLTTPSNRFVF